MAKRSHSTYARNILFASALKLSPDLAAWVFRTSTMSSSILTVIPLSGNAATYYTYKYARRT